MFNYSELTVYFIIIGGGVVLLLFSFLLMWLSEKREKVAFIDDGQSPGNMFVGNGIGIRVLGQFHRNFHNKMDRSEYNEYKLRKKSKKKAPNASNNNMIDRLIQDDWFVRFQALVMRLSEDEYKRRIKEDQSFANSELRLYLMHLNSSTGTNYEIPEPEDSPVYNTFSFLENSDIVVGYAFLCIIVPLIPFGCYAYKTISSSSRRTEYHFYGSQKWYLGEVFSILLGGWGGCAIVGGILAIIAHYVF